MKQYHDLLKDILINGDFQYDPRTEEYVLGISGHLSNYDLREGFPLVTTKKIPYRLVFEELFWKLRGERNIKSLFDRNVHIWDGNAFDHYLKRHNLKSKFPKHTKKWDKKFEWYKEKIAKNPNFALVEGDLGPIYGYQWRHWKKKDGEEIDQLQNILKSLKEKPGSRYHIISAWNVGELEEMALGPCPFWHQFTVYGKNLDLHTVQRSCDVYIGVPFNIAQEAAFLHLVAKETGLNPRRFIHDYVNAHIYLGVPPRAKFFCDKRNLTEFKNKVRGIKDPEQYIELREWYINNAPPEEEKQKRKDHMPFVLEQLSKKPKKLPNIIIQDIPLFDLIKRPADKIIKIEGYEFCEWDSSARMAV